MRYVSVLSLNSRISQRAASESSRNRRRLALVVDGQFELADTNDLGLTMPEMCSDIRDFPGLKPCTPFLMAGCLLRALINWVCPTICQEEDQTTFKCVT